MKQHSSILISSQLKHTKSLISLFCCLLLILAFFRNDNVQLSASSSEDVPPCRLVREESGDQCQYVLEHCKPTSGFGNYYKLYYCTLRGRSFIGMLALVSATIYSFLMLGTAAGEYLCPNLSNISQWLHLSESVAGVTLAAFGNGAPDLFSTFSAMRANTAGLAIGELLGAAMFVTLVVVGAVAIVTPFKLPRRPFIRDVVAFIGALLLVFVICVDKKITHAEGWSLICYYFAYVTVVIVGAWIYRRQKAQRLQEPPVEVAAGDTIDEEVARAVDVPSRDIIATPLSVVSSSFYERDRPFFETDPLLGSADQSDDMFVEEDGFDADFFLPHFKPTKLPSDFLKFPSRLSRSYTSPDGVHFSGRAPPPQSPFRRNSDAARGQSDAEPGFFSNKEARVSSSTEVPSDPLSQAHMHTEAMRVPEATSYHQPAEDVRRWGDSTLSQVLERLFPALYRWHSLRLGQRVQALILFPLYFIFSLTTPTVHPEEMELAKRREKARIERHFTESVDVLVDPDAQEADGDTCEVEEEQEVIVSFKTVNRHLTIVQLAIAPFFVALALHDLGSKVGKSHFPTWAIYLILSLSLTVIAIILTQRTPVIKFGRLLACIGFFTSVMWVFVIASEVVGILTAMATILGVSPTIMGLTLFAIGNSVGDLMTNISIARMGYPTMAVGACFGSPMLNLVLGIGVTSTYITGTSGQPYGMHQSMTPVYACAASLLVALMASLVYIPWNGFKATRTYGAALILAYGILMGIILLVSNQ